MRHYLVFGLLRGLGEAGHGHAVEDLREDGALHLCRFAVARRREEDLAGGRILEVLHQKFATWEMEEPAFEKMKQLLEQQKIPFTQKK